MRLPDYFDWRGVHPDPALLQVVDEGVVPRGSPIEAILAADGLEDLLELHALLPTNFIPLVLVDDVSVACIAAQPLDIEAETELSSTVVRFFIYEGPSIEQQARLLDVDARFFLHSWKQELDARQGGLDRILDQIGPSYEEVYIENDRRPKGFVVRPVRIACQNVIMGLAAISQDSSIDGLSVVAWQTCEAPHVATHEANRALAALTLCDAFQNGGTMEIRFDRYAEVVLNGKKVPLDGHPEGRVPASLRRFGRTVGIALGAEDRAAITPAEARELFLAVTPMPAGLQSRVANAISTYGIAPERICFTLMSQIWREIEVDYLLAVSQRAEKILEGGSPWTHRTARQTEMESSRAALMIGMLYRTLNGTDSAAADDAARVVEDLKQGITWDVDEATGAVRLEGIPSGALPWAGAATVLVDGELTVFPSSHLSTDLATTIEDSATRSTTAVLVPRDVEVPIDLGDVLVLRCPDRLADLDRAVEAKLVKSMVSR